MSSTPHKQKGKRALPKVPIVTPKAKKTPIKETSLVSSSQSQLCKLQQPKTLSRTNSLKNITVACGETRSNGNNAKVGRSANDTPKSKDINGKQASVARNSPAAKKRNFNKPAVVTHSPKTLRKAITRDCPSNKTNDPVTENLQPISVQTCTPNFTPGKSLAKELSITQYCDSTPQANVIILPSATVAPVCRVLSNDFDENFSPAPNSHDGFEKVIKPVAQVRPRTRTLPEAPTFSSNLSNGFQDDALKDNRNVKSQENIVQSMSYESQNIIDINCGYNDAVSKTPSLKEIIHPHEIASEAPGFKKVIGKKCLKTSSFKEVIQQKSFGSAQSNSKSGLDSSVCVAVRVRPFNER